jgi:O-acetyl-ADP-ribose deacetylase (regulator of RNase III)
MITYMRGDLFTSPAAVLVNTVNTVGVMGKGVAKEFKRYYPDMFREYQQRCERGEFTIGDLCLFHHPHKSVMNFPTKKHWRSPSKLEYIEQGLQTFVREYRKYKVHSIAFPQLGCGNGELDWESQVRPLMQEYLGPLPILVYIHLYSDSGLVPEHRNVQWMRDWLRTEPEYLAVNEAWEDVKAVVESMKFSEVSEWIVRIEIDAENEVDFDGDFGDAMEEIVFEHNGERVTFKREDFAHVWSQLRELGVIPEEELPRQLVASGAPYDEILTELKYIERVEFSFARVAELSQYSPTATNETPVKGFKLVPRPAFTQPELLTV